MTFRQLFITGTCLIFPITFWNMVQIMTDFSKNNGILSLFLMLILALVYVVLLHLALSGVVKLSDPAKEKTEITGAKVWNNKKKVAIASIYVIRYAIRVLFSALFLCTGEPDPDAAGLCRNGSGRSGITGTFLYGRKGAAWLYRICGSKCDRNRDHIGAVYYLWILECRFFATKRICRIPDAGICM